MPLVDELSLAVAGFHASYSTAARTSGLDTAISKLIQRNFEEALSYLAERKPWLEESENQKDKVRLLELTRNIRVVIARRQAAAREDIGAGRCDWIVPLFEYWHKNRSVVITLNYDTLIEEIIERIGTAKREPVPHPVHHNSFSTHPLDALRVCNIYPGILKDAWLGTNSGGFRNSFENQPSFRLLKLHGSVNWFKSDAPNADSDTISYVAGTAVPTTPVQGAPAAVEDKAPYIVAPVPNKGGLVQHDSLRAMWREASEAIKWSRRIVIMGYSMPANDTLFIQLIRGNLFNSKPAIELVSPDKTLLTKVTKMFDGEESVVEQRFSEENCVRDFVEKEEFAATYP